MKRKPFTQAETNLLKRIASRRSLCGSGVTSKRTRPWGPSDS